MLHPPLCSWHLYCVWLVSVTSAFFLPSLWFPASLSHSVVAYCSLEKYIFCLSLPRGHPKPPGSPPLRVPPCLTAPALQLKREGNRIVVWADSFHGERSNACSEPAGVRPGPSQGRWRYPQSSGHRLGHALNQGCDWGSSLRGCCFVKSRDCEGVARSWVRRSLR